MADGTPALEPEADPPPAAPDEEMRALRMLCSLLHGFATLDASDGFRLGADIDSGFAWLIAFIDRGLRT